AGVPALERRVGSERQFRGIEFLIVQHALKCLPRAQDFDVELDALRLDPPIHERAGAVVIPTGKGELQIGHWGLSSLQLEQQARLSLPRQAGGRLAKRAGWGSNSRADLRPKDSHPTAAASRRHVADVFASAFLALRTAAEGRLCSPFQGEV